MVMAPTLPVTAPAVPSPSLLPAAVQRYAAGGDTPSAIRRDLVTVSNQIPRWGYLAFAGVAAWMAYRSWKRKPTEKLTA